MDYIKVQKQGKDESSQADYMYPTIYKTMVQKKDKETTLHLLYREQM